MRVHNRIVVEDLFGGLADDEDNDSVVTVRLLVPSNMVGCIIGKGGEIIQGLRNETGASIRVLPTDQLPTCALSSDELVQISGNQAVVKRALYDVSTRLHQNPREDKSSSFPMPLAGQGFHHSAPRMTNRPPPGNPMWSQQNTPNHLSPVPWMGGYGNPSPGFMPGGFNDGPTRHGGEPAGAGEFSMKMLCLPGKIGRVIGYGGASVRQLQQETGASIHAEEATTDSEERVIRVSAFETLANPRSQTIDAILQLQAKASEFSDKGIITTRILVSSSKVGCIIGKAGSIISEMRWRTKADIRVFAKEDRPKCASEDEELVQVSGSFAVAKDALAEIASRLRTRCLRDGNAGPEPAPEGPVPGYGPAGGFPSRGVVPSGSSEVGSSAGHSVVKDGSHDYDPSYPVPPIASGYPNASSSAEMKYSNNAVGPAFGPGGSIINNTVESVGSRLRLHDPQAGVPEVAVDIRGTTDHLNAPHNILPTYMDSGGQKNPPQGSYSNPSSQQAVYPHAAALPPDPYTNANPQEIAYQNSYVQQGPYQNPDAQHNAYHNVAVQGSYQY
ncbi:hypothetical protein Nepgr_029030 [Nepenthes gracilis]|uniref:K Homology domain-containing protein n=1 Tax=Nepenthes gracilis TaxID=150966 RepID=A0AAD3TD67_NEPGR|nr:hypothetical protein Nepgr_029030 [Nepenthes gracilis]